MPKIKIIEKNENYGYEYIIIDYNQNKHCISRNGFKTRDSAIAAARKSYDRKKKEFIEAANQSYEIKDLKCTNKMAKLLTLVTVSGIGFTLVVGGVKLTDEFNNKFNKNNPNSIVADEENHTIEPTECDFSDLQVIIRSAKSDTDLTAKVVEDELNRIGIFNKVINKDANYINEINNLLKENSNNNIIFINLETGLGSNDNITILNNYYNNNKYSSDVLTSCIKASSIEYNFNTRVRSGIKSSEGWRVETSIEKKLKENDLKNKVTQLTIDLPETINDELIRNNAASSIVDGLIRFSYLPKEERYNDVYYCVKYGDTLYNVSDDYNISVDYISSSTGISPYTKLEVGDTLVIGDIPKVAKDNYNVNNPTTTSDINEVLPIYIHYIVKENDTLLKIAKKNGVNLEDIIIESGNPNNIKVGEDIVIKKKNYYLTSPKTIKEEEIYEKNR